MTITCPSKGMTNEVDSTHTWRDSSGAFATHHQPPPRGSSEPKPPLEPELLLELEPPSKVG
jgi:hypothetical protein